MKVEQQLAPEAGKLMFFDDYRDTHLIILFEPTVRDLYAPFVRDYCDVLLNRISPIFDEIRESDAPLEDKILAFWHHKNGRTLFNGNEEEKEDHSGYWGIGAENVSDMQAMFLAIGVTGLFHLFEKQLYQFINGQLYMWLRSSISHWADLGTLLEKFDRKANVAARCTEVIDTFKNPDLVELVLVANSVKHGGGKSYEKLVEMKSRVVSEERLLKRGALSILNVPLFISVEDVIRYQDVITRFWTLSGAFYAPHAAFNGVRESPDWSLRP